MSNSLAKKAFAVGLAASTILMGLAPFAAKATAHGDGSVVSDSTGTVYFIQSGMRRPFTSAGAFLSYGFLSWSQVSAANSDDLALPVGSFIPPQDGKIICSDRGADKGTCYLITGGMKAGFTSASVFTGLGFSFSRATYGDVSWMSSTSNIDSTTQAHRPGVLVNNNGTVQLVGTSSLLGIPDIATFNSWGDSFSDVVKANAADQAIPQSGVMATRVAGQLSPVAMSGGNGGNTGTPGPTGGAVTVTLASDTPAASTLATGTAHDAVLKVNLTAGSMPVSITGFNVTKGGYFANTNISGVSVYDASGHRHGNEVTTLGANGVATLTFSQDPIVVAAGSTMPVWFKVNLASGNNTGTVTLGINAATDVMTNGGSVSGTFPVVGNVFNIVNGGSSVAAVTLDEQPVNASGVTYNVDPNNEQQVAKFRIQETSSNEGVKFFGMTLWNNGNAAQTDYKDVQLQDQTGAVIATAQPVGQTVTFDLSSNPFFIDKGQTKDFSVWAKVVGGTTRTIQFTVYNNYDLDVRGNNTGAGLLPSAGSNDTSFPIGDSTSTYNKVTIGNGTLQFVRDAASPSTSAVPGATGVELARYDVKAQGEDMEIRGIAFGIANASTTGTALTGTVYVKVDGNIVYSAAGNSTNFPLNDTGTSVTRTLSSYFVIHSGVQSVITVVGDVSSSAGTADKYTVKGFDVTSVKRLTSNDIVDPGVAATDGNQISVQAASLVVTTLATPVATQYVPVTTQAPLASFQLNAGGSGEDVKVSSITVTDTLGSGSTYTGVANLVMYASNGTALQTSSSTNTNGNTTTFNFTTPILVSRTAPVTLTLKGDIQSSTGVSHTFKIAAAANVTATGATTGNSVASASITVSGAGQTMTVATAGNLIGSLVTGTNGTPSLKQVVNVGTSGNTYLAFKLTAQYESEKVTALTIRATGTSLTQNDVVNIQLFRQVGSGAIDSTPFATAQQFASCASNACSYSWSATDNLLPAPIDPASPVTVYVKADVGGQNVAKLGDDFYMGLDMSAGITAKGVQSAAAPTYSGGFLQNTTAPSVIVPFQVLVTGDYPASGTNQLTSLGAGTVIGRFKVTNNGNAQVTLTNFTPTDSGAHTGTSARYTLYFSNDGDSAYTANSASTTQSDTLAFGSSFTGVTINGGSFRYVTITASTVTGLASGDTYNLSISALGNVKFSVAESALGYDGNQDGALSTTLTGLFADGKPTLGTVQKQ